MQSSLLLLVPLISINAGEAALRYALEYKEKRGLILYNGLKRVSFSILPVALISLLLSFLIPGERVYFLLFIALYAANSFYEYMLLYCQGSEEVEKMICGSVSCTALVIAANLLFLLVFRLGIYGYLFSQIIAFTGSALIMFILIKGSERLKDRKEDEALEREMFGYSRGMLLYSTASWVNNAIDRYYILFLLGSSENGLYGAAYKIPAILATVQRIFAQAWQMSTVKEYKGSDRDQFFSGMYRLYEAVLVICCSGIILFLKPLAFILFRKGFYGAWILVPPLLISVIFGALEGFLGSIALAFKDGKSMGIATGTGAVFNMILNYFLIKRYGTMGAALATEISYCIMFVLALWFVKKHVELKTKPLRGIVSFILLQAEAFFIMTEIKYHVPFNAGIVIILMCLYFTEIREVAIKGIGMIKKRTGNAG